MKKVIDNLIFWKYLLIIFFKIIRFVFTKNPFTTIKVFRRFSWLSKAMLNFANLYFNLCRYRKGSHLKATAITIDELTDCLLEYIGNALYHPEKVILIEEIMAPEIFLAMGFTPFAVEVPSLLLPVIDPHGLSDYIDKAENYGIPSDICSLLKGSIGMMFEDEIANGQALVTSNSPCDNHISTYILMETKTDIPFYRLDIPYNFTTERAADYFVEELKEMVKWLESNTTCRMDWEKLRDICEVRNQWIKLQLEFWDTLRIKPAPVAGEAVWLPYWLASLIQPSSKRNIKMFENLLNISRQNLEQNVAAVPNEKFRVLMWNMPIFHFFDVFGWAEKTWGVSLVAEGLSFNRIPLIDTKTNESMLRGIANLTLYAPMA